MANQTPTLPDSDQDSLNPGERINQEKLNGSYTSAGLDQLEAFANDPNSHDAKSVNELEAAPGLSGAKSSWQDSTTPQRVKAKGSFFTRKKAGIIGGSGGIIGIVIFFISGFTSAGGLLINLGEGATDSLDSRGSILSRRLFSVIDQKMVGSTTSGSCEIIKIACRFSRPSNAFLSRLDDYGIQAYYGDPADPDSGSTKVEKKTVGFNDRPTHYGFTDSKGTFVSVDAKNFASTLRTNAEFRKLFTSAFNMRYWGYASSTIKKLFYNKNTVDRSGKTVNELDPDKPGDSVKNITSDADKDNPVRKAGSDVDAKNKAATELIGDAVDKEVRSAANKVAKGQGDPILTGGAIACLAINVPSFVTNVVRIYQMRQLIAVAANIVLVSSSMIKAGDMKPEQMAVIGGLLTATSLLPDGTKTKSAMDSFGIKSILFGDTGNAGSSYKNIIPGGKIAAEFGTINGVANNPEVKQGCASINSPEAQVAVAGVEAAISAATAGTALPGIALLKGAGLAAAKLGIITALMEAAAEPIANVVTGIISTIPPETIAAALSNDAIENASGEDLGNVIGAGLRFFYSNGCLATGCRPLAWGQVVAFADMQKNEQIAYEEQDRIGRSPFDISSSSTFLGKIASNYYKDAYVGTSFGQNIISTLGYTIRQPLSLLSDTSYAAADKALAQCSHAEEFGVDSSVAIGPFSDICAGVPAEYLDVSNEEVLNTVSGMIDENTGAPLADKEVATTLSECGGASLLNAQGCVITSQEQANESIYMFDYEINNILDEESTTSDSNDNIINNNLAYSEQAPTVDYSSVISQLIDSYKSVSVPSIQPSVTQTATTNVIALGVESRTVKDRVGTTLRWAPSIG